LEDIVDNAFADLKLGLKIYNLVKDNEGIEQKTLKIF